jgi:hypothetical protein
LPFMLRNQEGIALGPNTIDDFVTLFLEGIARRDK